MTALPVILKSDGTTEPFDLELLVSSLELAGAGVHTASRIARLVGETVTSGTTSKDIYSRAFALLRKEERPVAARYAARRALLELGPTGHPFEDFMGHLFQVEGWRVETRKMIRGQCVEHEVDIYASHPDQNTFLAAELKYHNNPGYKTDLKVALYVKSRFDDIFACDPSIRACPIDRGMLITNTKFTTEAIRYAECSGVELLGWGYPIDNTLYMHMARAKVYPITSLTSFSRAEKNLMIEHGVVAVDELVGNRALLDILHLPVDRVGWVLAEAEGLLGL